MRNTKEYYKLLGKLAYAVAMADGLIQKEELIKLKELVLKEFAKAEKGFDSSGMNKAFYIEFEFEDSIKNRPDWQETAKSFAEFLEENAEKTDTTLIQSSLHLLKDVALAYCKSNEQTIIDTISNKINNTVYN